MADFVTTIKQYSVDDRFRIQLHDAVSEETRRVIGVVSGDRFLPNSAWSDEAFRTRVTEYDDTLSDLCRAEALMAHWAGRYCGPTITLPIERLADASGEASGLNLWLALRWYPSFVLMYSAGISAVAANRYDVLASVLAAPLMARTREHGAAVVATIEGLRDAAGAFKLLPKMERKYVPVSEHMFALLRSLLESVLFLGSAYERSFDRFEVLTAVEYMHRAENRWPLVGRFGWKSSYRESSPLHQMIAEAEATKEVWPPLVAGLCGGSFERFGVISQRLVESVARREMG